MLHEVRIIFYILSIYLKIGRKPPRVKYLLILRFFFVDKSPHENKSRFVCDYIFRNKSMLYRKV